MEGRAPFPPPGQPYDPDPMFANPGSTIPRPLPSNMPAPYWQSARTFLGWRGVAGGFTNVLGATYRHAIWRTPTFDLRPELGLLGQTDNISKPGSVPIWRPYGSGGELFVQLHLQNNSHGGISVFNDLNITSYDECSPWDAIQLLPITPEQDVTTAFTSSNQSNLGFNPVGTNRGVNGMCVFGPPGGGGSPVRYWRLTLVFRQYLQHPDPINSITAGYY